MSTKPRKISKQKIEEFEASINHVQGNFVTSNIDFDENYINLIHFRVGFLTVNRLKQLTKPTRSPKLLIRVHDRAAV